MIKQSLKNSTRESIKKDELLANLNLFVDSKHVAAVADVLTRAFEGDTSLDIDHLCKRCSGVEFDSSLNPQVGTVLFFLSAELW